MDAWLQPTEISQGNAYHLASMILLSLQSRHLVFCFLGTCTHKASLDTYDAGVMEAFYREVSLRCKSFGEVVEGVGLGAHWIAVSVDFVEEVGRFVKAVVTDVHILLLHSFWPSCSLGQGVTRRSA